MSTKHSPTTESEVEAPAASLQPVPDGAMMEKVQRVERKAAGLADDELQTCRVNPDVMPPNLNVTLATLSTPEAAARIQAHLPKVELGVLRQDLSDGTKVLAFLGHQAQREDNRSFALEQQIDEGFVLREMLDHEIALGVLWKLIPAEEGEKLTPIKGRSPVALGNRIVGGAMVLTSHLPKLAGRHYFPPGWLDQVTEKGHLLCEEGSVRFAVSATKERGPMAQRRDRVYTWLSGRYEEARGIVGYLYPGKVDEKAPPLFSRRVVRHKASDEAAPAKVEAPKPEAAKVATGATTGAEAGPGTAAILPAHADPALRAVAAGVAALVPVPHASNGSAGVEVASAASLIGASVKE